MEGDRMLSENSWVQHEDGRGTTEGGFTQVSNAVLCSTVISPEAKIVYAVLRKAAWQDPTCYPGMAWIAQRCNMGEKRARRARREIEREVDASGQVKRKADVVALIETRRRGQGDTNIYRFLDPEESLNGQFDRSRTDKTYVPERTPSADNEYTGNKDSGNKENGPGTAGGGTAPNGITQAEPTATAVDLKSFSSNRGSETKANPVGVPGPGSPGSATAGESGIRQPTSGSGPDPVAKGFVTNGTRGWWRLYKDRAREAGIEVSELDPKIIGANLPRLAKRDDVSEAEMHAVIDTMLSKAASGRPAGSPQQTLEKIREATRAPDPWASLVGWQVSGDKARAAAAAGRLDSDNRITAAATTKSNGEADTRLPLHSSGGSSDSEPEPLPEAPEIDEDGWVTLG